MIMADKEHNKDFERGMSIFSECLAGMMYSDEEILGTLSPDDAAEFMELRNNLLSDKPAREVFLDGYDNGDEISMPLAAEDEEGYR